MTCLVAYTRPQLFQRLKTSQILSMVITKCNPPAFRLPIDVDVVILGDAEPGRGAPGANV